MKSFPELARGGLARRYFLAIGGAVSLVLLLAIGVETPMAYRAMLERVGDVQMADLRSAAARVNEYLQGVERALRDSASVPWLKPPFSAEDQRLELHRLLKLVPALDRVILANESGTPQVSVSRLDPDNAADASIDPALLAEARQKGFALGSLEFKDGLEPVVTLVLRGAPAAGGYIAARLNLRNVSDIVSGVRVGQTGAVFLVEASDRVVAHPDSARTMQRLSERGRRQVSELRSRLQGDPPIAAPAEGEDAEGTPVLASAIGLPRLGWMIIAQEPLETALAAVRATVLRLFALMASGILVAIFVGAAMARRLSRPILSLRRGTQKLAGGDLASRIEVRTGDEIEELANDFNRMAAQLEDYTHGLERKVAEQTTDLRAALKAANDAMRARAIFLAAASHDLRQPLYAISILSDALAGQPLSPEAQAILGKQQEAIAALRRLFDNLLDLSRLDAGEVRPVRRAVALREVLGQLAGEYQATAQAKGLEWHAAIPEVWVETDPELLRRVLANLLSNAVRYTRQGRIELVAREVSRGSLEISVSDTGIGIAAQDQARVFEEFVQIENDARDREKGVGLGLSIVRKIGELLDLRIALSSAPGQGTRISLQVPLTAAREGPLAEAVPVAGVEQVAGKRLWVVEDDRLVREALAAQLGAWDVDYEFALSRDDLDALRASDGAWPDAVMLDDMLGQADGGLELAAWLGPRMDKRRIVIVTGNVNSQRLAELAASDVAVLRKPLSSAQILEWLAAATAEPVEEAQVRSSRAAERAG
ncbi:MAG TPA: ATP-binding protein [Usitatibacter sp.]|nr:ATP-binding protein [Usitatibacter sp.]